MAENVFVRLETKEKDLSAKRLAGREGEPHVIRVGKGAAPEYIRLGWWEMTSWRVMGRLARRNIDKHPNLDDDLLKAHMKIRPEEYLAVAYMNTFVAGVSGAVLGVVLFLVLSMAGLLMVGGIMLPVLALAVPVGVFFGTLGGPASRAKQRGKDIDLRIASAMSFISAMSSANVNVDVIFRELSRQPIYGAIQEEAEWVTRDAEFLGIDILTALKRAALRTPSRKFQDFLQGVVTTSTSGGQLKPYFLVKAEQYEKENKLDLKARMETLGLMAETFVTVVVAFPLFLVVILAIMALIGGSGMVIVIVIYIIVGVMVPAMQVMFIWLIRGLSQEV